MIQVNLLPQHLRPIKRTPLPYILCGLVLILTLLWMAASFVKTEADILVIKKTLDTNQTQLAGLQNIVDQSNELDALKQSLANRILTIQEIVQDQIIWSEQLHRLSKLTPDNVWYNGIKVITKTVTIQVPDIDPETNEPRRDPNTGQIRMVPRPMDQRTLTVKGYVVDTPERTASVNPLMRFLATDPDFTKLFAFDRPTIRSTYFGGFAVKEFTLEFVIAAAGDAA